MGCDFRDLVLDLPNNGQELGLELSPHNFLILSIQVGGLVDEHNSENPSDQVRLKDKVLSVNGCRIGNAAHYHDAVANAEVAKLELRRMLHPKTLDGEFNACVITPVELNTAFAFSRAGTESPS